MTNTNEQMLPVIEKIKAKVAGGRPIDVIVEYLAALQQQQLALIQEMRVLRAKQALYDGALPEMEAAYRGRLNASIDAAMPLRKADGFHEIEYDRDGKAYRWTGPDAEFRFDLHLDRSAALIFQVVLGTQSNGSSTAVRAYSDGAEIPLMPQKGPAGHRFVGIIFPRAAAGLTRISFVPDEVFSPSATDASSTDRRVLGVIFKSMIVSPATSEDLATYTSHFGVGNL